MVYQGGRVYNGISNGNGALIYNRLFANKKCHNFSSIQKG
jgi:hypothetical protein